MDLGTRQGRREQGVLIQRVVERAGVSVEELANRIGCSRALIYQYLSGTTLAQPDRLQQIAIEVGVPLSYFYSGELLEDSRKGRRGSQSEDVHVRLSERIQQLEELAAAQENPVDWSALASTCERLIGLASQAYDKPTESRALLRLGRARIRMGEFSRAVESLEKAATHFAELSDQPAEADARQALGNALLANGRISEARDQFTWVAASPRWNARWSGTVSLAAIDEQLGDYKAAMARCDEAASILEEGKDVHDMAHGMLYVNANRVNIYLACGDFQSATGLAQKCLADAEALGSGDQHLEARLNLAFCALYQGKWALCHRTLHNALPIARFLGDKGRQAMILATLAMLLAEIGDYDSSAAHAKDALASALALGDHRAELFAQMALTDSYIGPARDSEARYHANQALAVATALRLSLFQAECRLRLARLSLRSQDFAEVREHLAKSLEIADRLGARHIRAQANALLAAWKLVTGEVQEAEAAASAALQLSKELGIVPLEWEAQAQMARVEQTRESWEPASVGDCFDRSIGLLESVRTDIREAGIPDTILENGERQQIYLDNASFLAEFTSREEALAFIQQAAWPPLVAKLQALISGG